MEVLAASGLLNLDGWEEGMALTDVSSVGRRVQIGILGNLRASEHVHRRHSANKQEGFEATVSSDILLSIGVKKLEKEVNLGLRYYKSFFS